MQDNCFCHAAIGLAVPTARGQVPCGRLLPLSSGPPSTAVSLPDTAVCPGSSSKTIVMIISGYYSDTRQWTNPIPRVILNMATPGRSIQRIADSGTHIRVWHQNPRAALASSVRSRVRVGWTYCMYCQRRQPRCPVSTYKPTTTDHFFSVADSGCRQGSSSDLKGLLK